MAHDHGGDHGDDDGLADLLDLDGQVLHAFWSDVLEAVAHVLGGDPPRRILDVGAGTGVGSIALARAFDAATVIALDADASMAHRLVAAAARAGVAGRVSSLQADLDHGLPDLPAVDLIWASQSMHHLADPDRLLRELLASLRPGGAIAVVEFEEPLRFLSGDPSSADAALEARYLAALAARRHDDLPHLGSHWAPRLTAAGFAEVSEREFVIALDPPLPEAASRYAYGWLERVRHGLADVLDPSDLAALEEMLGDGPRSARHRQDLRIAGSRTLTLARRPAH